MTSICPWSIRCGRISTPCSRAACRTIRIGRTRSNIGFDLYNLFNANTGTGFNRVFNPANQVWLNPNAILNPRYLRFNATIDF